MLDKNIVDRLRAARSEVETIAAQVNVRVEEILSILIGLADSKWTPERAEDMWWWFGVDDDRPFRRGDRHGYLRGDDSDSITIYLDEPHIGLPGFDQYTYNTPRKYSETKKIPVKYLSMSNEDIIADATAIMAKVKQQDQDQQQAQADAKNAALSKLTDEEKRTLGLKV